VDEVCEIFGKLAFDFSEFQRIQFPSRLSGGRDHAEWRASNIEFRIGDMVKIRLRREGTKDRPYYRIVVADGRARREGAYIEQLGTYDPLRDKSNFNIDLAKADEWIGKGAQPSETVRSLMKKARQASA
jgi:small subunit ribosomal protein S16